MIVYLVRHAHAEWQPDEMRPLSPRGRRDAVRVADLLAGRPIGAVISSPYRRAVQTVEPLAAALSLEIQTEDRFRERRLGDWSAESLRAAVERTWQDFDFCYPGGESDRAAQARAVAALDELRHSKAGDHCVIGTHGNLLALLLRYYDPDLGFDFWSALSMPDVYELQIARGAPTVHSRLWGVKA